MEDQHVCDHSDCDSDYKDQQKEIKTLTETIEKLEKNIARGLDSVRDILNSAKSAETHLED